MPLAAGFGFLLVLSAAPPRTAAASAETTMPASAVAPDPSVPEARSASDVRETADPGPRAGAVDPDSTLGLWRAGWRRVELRAHADSLRLQLPARWIDATTFRLFRGDTLLALGSDYLLDPRGGSIRLLRDLPDGARLHARFRAFPLPVRGEYRLHRPTLLDPDEAPDGPDAAAPGPLTALTRGLEEEAQLRIAGSKTFSVNVGTQQDLSLEQSLDLSIQGRIGRDVNVRAILSDRDTPLQPEGTSTQLEDLDRVLLEIEGPRASMTLGDYFLTVPPTEFARYGRQLQGVRGDARPGPVELFATGATTPGTFTSVEFLGQEGKQGPYELQRTGPRTEGTIVAGSETVWLDERALVRGENEDYIIDYARGTVTFTARHPITAYSRIAVDFQIAAERYNRTIFGGGGSTGDPRLLQPAATLPGRTGWEGLGYPVPVGEASAGGGRFARDEAGEDKRESRHAVRALWLTERDDRDDPVGLPLTEAEKQALGEAGDQDTEDLRSGIRFVGEGEGDYEQVFTDTLVTPFFVWAPEEGSYLITFEDVGEENGAYRDTTGETGERYFVFVGEENGRYLPGREVARPRSTSLFTVRTGSRFGFGMRLNTEVSVSDHDANTFSDLDDGDNQGLAFLVQGRSAPWSLAGGEVTAGLRVRQIDDRFEPLDRLEESFFERDWNVERERLADGDQRVGVDLAYERARSGLRVELERLSNQTDFRAMRGIVSATAAPGPFRVQTRLLRTETEDELGPDGAISGLRRTETASVRYPGAWIDAGVRYAGEHSRRGGGATRSGLFYHEGGARLGTGHRWTQLRLTFDYSRRRTYDIEGTGESLADVGATATAEVDWRTPGGGSVFVSYTRRSLDPRDGRSRSENQLASVRWLQRFADDVIQQEGRFALSTSEERARIEEIVFVGEGEGHYDSLGVFQGIGDYEVFARELPEPIRLNRIDASFRTEVDLSRRDGAEGGSWWNRLTRQGRIVHYWTARIESDRSASYLWPRILPVLTASRDFPFAEAQLRTDVSTLSGARWFSPRLRWELRRQRSGLEGSLQERANRNLLALRLRSRPVDIWSFDLEQEWEVDRREVVTAGAAGGGRTGWESFRTAIDHEVALGRRISVSLEGGVRLRERIGAPETATVVEGTPILIWNPRPRSRVELRTTRTSVTRRDGVGRPSRDLETPGWRTRLVANVRLREALDLSLFLRESRPDQGARVRDARMELRATF